MFPLEDALRWTIDQYQQGPRSILSVFLSTNNKVSVLKDEYPEGGGYEESSLNFKTKDSFCECSQNLLMLCKGLDSERKGYKSIYIYKGVKNLF